MRRFLILSAMLLGASAVFAADVTNPEEVANLLLGKSGGDVQLQWDAVNLDVAGNPETVGFYEVYRGTAAAFVPDKAGAGNRIGAPAVESFTDTTAAGAMLFYLVGAVDAEGNKGVTRDSELTAAPVLSGFWTDTTVELDWTAAEPLAEVQFYRVYRGQTSGNYDFAEDVALTQTYSATGLATNVNWHFAVAAVDQAGNETIFSNEHIDPRGWHAERPRSRRERALLGRGGMHADRSRPRATLRRIPVARPGRLPCRRLGPGRGDVHDGVAPVHASLGGQHQQMRAGESLRTSDRAMVGTTRAATPGIDSRTCSWWWTTASSRATAASTMTTWSCFVQPRRSGPTPIRRTAAGVVPPRALTLDITPFTPLLAGQRRYIGAQITHTTCSAAGGSPVSSISASVPKTRRLNRRRTVSSRSSSTIAARR